VRGFPPGRALLASPVIGGHLRHCCPFTTSPIEAPLLRLPIDPSAENGLCQPSQLMVDKVTTVSRSSLGDRLGRLRDDELVRLNRSLIVFLGLASARQT
jgi:mRNA interferase MazF